MLEDERQGQPGQPGQPGEPGLQGGGRGGTGGAGGRGGSAADSPSLTDLALRVALIEADLAAIKARVLGENKT